MRGNFRAGSRPTLKQRVTARKDYLRRLAQREKSARCATCKAPLPAKALTVFGSADRYCRSLCLPSAGPDV